MKFLRKIRSKRRAGSNCLHDLSPLDIKERAELAREEEFYGVDNLAALDAAGLMKALMIHRHHQIYAQLDSLGRKYSMLHPDLLTVLYYLAKHLSGNVLEVGPFLGGATMATAIGLRERDRLPTFVTIEKGGKMPHPQLGTADILRDLKQNLIDNGFADLVRVVVGFSLGEETASTVRTHLASRSVTLLIIDADGEVRSVLDLYQELLSDGCWVVIDDYFASGIAVKKSALTKSQIEAAAAAGELEEFGFYGWGTWVGRWHRTEGGG